MCERGGAEMASISVASLDREELTNLFLDKNRTDASDETKTEIKQITVLQKRTFKSIVKQ